MFISEFPWLALLEYTDIKSKIYKTALSYNEDIYLKNAVNFSSKEIA